MIKKAQLQNWRCGLEDAIEAAQGFSSLEQRQQGKIDAVREAEIKEPVRTLVFLFLARMIPGRMTLKEAWLHSSVHLFE